MEILPSLVMLMDMLICLTFNLEFTEGISGHQKVNKSYDKREGL